MRHCPTEDVLLDYVAGSLAAAQLAEFERHAKECSRCDALAASQAAVWRNLEEWKPEPVSAGFNRELWRRIDADAAAPSWTARLHFWKQLAPLAAVLALVVTGFVMDHHSHPPVTAPAAVAVSASEADQLERTLDDLQLLEAVDTATPAKPAADLM
jgi:anti-sigma factor RsiW